MGRILADGQSGRILDESVGVRCVRGEFYQNTSAQSASIRLIAVPILFLVAGVAGVAGVTE